jgi:hypothetical protein
MSHPVEHLFHALASVEPYPEGVVRVPGRLPGIGFFPGGVGLWNAEHGSLRPLSPGLTMILGHNFDSEAGYRRSVARGAEDLNAATWRELTKFLRRALPKGEEGLTDCFFTNFFMGLIARGSSVGQFPGARDDAFVERCREFLRRQIEVMRPSLMLVLGMHTPRLIAPLASELEPWGKAKTFAELDRQNAGFIPRVVIAGVRLSVVALTHPSLRNSNVRHRHFNGLLGDAAEIELVRRAFASKAEAG